MNRYLFIALVLGLFSCKKETLQAFSDQEESIIHIQASAFEIVVKMTAYHELMAQGGSVYNNGAIRYSSDTIGALIYDTLSFTNVENNPYIHSIITGYSSSVRDLSGSTPQVTITLNNLVWNDAEFSGTISYGYSNLSLVSITPTGLTVKYKGKETVIQGILFANKSGVNHSYSGYMNGTGSFHFSWNTNQSFLCFGDYGFDNINSIPNTTLFTWKHGEATLNISDLKIREKIDESFYQINKVMIIHPNGDRRIYEYPFL